MTSFSQSNSVLQTMLQTNNHYCTTVCEFSALKKNESKMSFSSFLFRKHIKKSKMRSINKSLISFIEDDNYKFLMDMDDLDMI